MRTASRAVIVCLLLLPFLILGVHSAGLSLPDWIEFGYVTKFTFIQAVLSASVAVFFGMLGSLGLISLRKYRREMEVAILLPNFVPVLFVILSSMKLLSPFPFGLYGIVMIHTLLNVGLVSVVMARVLESRVGALSEVAWVSGVSSIKFLLKGVLPLIKKEVFQSFLFVFALCFTSFAVPLMAGGHKGATLEVLIYEKIRIDGLYGEALAISIFQMFAVLAFVIYISDMRPARMREKKNLSILFWPFGILLPLIVTVGLFGAQLEGLGLGFQQLQKLFSQGLEVWPPFLGTVKVGMLTGFTTLFLLGAVVLGWPNKFFHLFMNSYLAPSTVIVGFAFVLINLSSPIFDEFISLEIALGLSLLSLATLYRMKLGGELSSLREQYVLAQTMGADHLKIMKDVIFPQVLPTMGLLAAVAAFWACGDFAFSSVIASGDMTLGLLAKSFIGGYRLEAASLIVWLIMFVGVLCFMFFWSLGRVLSEKSYP